MAGVIDRFDKEHGFLSNFWRCSVVLDGCTYPSAENAYQALKCLDSSDQKIFQDPSCFPSKAKRLGRKVKIRLDWDDVRLEAMGMVVRAKFHQNMALGQKLVDTKDMELIEGNYWNDVFWGVCKGTGENNLGKILMEVREDLSHLIQEYHENQRAEYEDSILPVESSSNWMDR